MDVLEDEGYFAVRHRDPKRPSRIPGPLQNLINMEDADSVSRSFLATEDESMREHQHYIGFLVGTDRPGWSPALEPENRPRFCRVCNGAAKRGRLHARQACLGCFESGQDSVIVPPGPDCVRRRDGICQAALTIHNVIESRSVHVRLREINAELIRLSAAPGV